jgi:hypothetical protein
MDREVGRRSLSMTNEATNDGAEGRRKMIGSKSSDMT